MRHAAIFQRGAHVGEIEIDKRRIDDQFRNAADTLTKHFVRYFQRFGERSALFYHAAQFIVGNHDDGIHILAEFFHAGKRVVHFFLAFERERKRYHGYGENFHFPRELGDNGRSARARTSAHTGGDEKQVGSL